MQHAKCKLAIAVCAAILLVGISIAGGFFIGDAAARSRAARQLGTRSAPGNSTRRLQELPPTGSNEAAKLLTDPNTPEYILEIYTYLNDAATITRETTVAFLAELKRLQEASKPNTTLDVEPFIPVATDLLDYFRTRYSQALLPLLRKFSQDGLMVATEVSPDMLQQEIRQLLSTTSLNSYYSSISRRCGHASAGAKLAVATETVGSAGAGAAQVKVAGRRLLQQHLMPAVRRRLWSVADTAVHPWAARTAAAQRTAAGGSVVAVAATAAPPAFRSFHNHSRRLQQQSMPGSLQDTICQVPDSNWPDGGSGPPDITFGCPSMQQHPPAAGFQPVELPVVVHCLRFPSEDGESVMPAIVTPDKAGQKMVNVVNKHFDNTGIRFKLQEVRTDIKKYPYLLLPSVAEWLKCGPNSNSELLNNQGLACLKTLSEQPSVVALASQLVINVFVAGSSHGPYCSQFDMRCNHTLYGITQAPGPWWKKQYRDIIGSASYQEGDSRNNWLWLRFTEFDVGGRNRATAWNAGGNTLAHELAHYLALMHTFEDGCSGDQPDMGDGVTDTPPCQELSDFDAAEPQDLHLELGTWCSKFRNGNQPLVEDLKTFNSCPRPSGGQQHAADAAIDGVFNLMAYLPEACYIGALTPGQIERLQAMVARYRPRMVDAYKVP